MTEEIRIPVEKPQFGQPQFFADLPEQAQYEEVPEPEEASVEDLSDLTKVTKADILGKADGNTGEIDVSDLTTLDEQDMDDLFGVSNEDIIGVPPKPKPRITRRFRRTNKPYYPPPPTTLGGIR